MQFDAHRDVSDAQFGSAYIYGSAFRRAVEAGIIIPSKAVQIGIPGSWHGTVTWGSRAAPLTNRLCPAKQSE